MEKHRKWILTLEVRFARRYTQAMKISTKLFLTFFCLTALILITTLSLARWSFQQGFMEFISGLERQRLESAAITLTDQYAQSGNNWSAVERLGLNYFVAQRRGPPRPMGHRPGPPPPRQQQGPPGRTEPNSGRPRPTGPGQGKLNDGPPTALFDVNNNLIAGEIPKDVQEALFVHPIELNNEQIGELRSYPETALKTGIASQFLHQQQVASIIIGLTCLALAILISWILSRKILTPIKSVIAGVAQLTDGKYDVEYEDKRGDELGQLMRNVEFLSVTLDKTRSARNRMFADISHELRTPLTVLSGEIEVLKAGIRPFDMQQLASLEQETNLLKHIVDDLNQLSMSDVGALKYHFELTDLGECVERVLQGMQLQAKSKGLELEVQVILGMNIKLDQKRIEQLLLNLCSNAIAYTDAPGSIVVTMQSVEGAIQVLFNDTIPAVTEQDCQKLFEPLFRLDESRTRKETGAGLGLAISKNIVEAHNGKIWAHPSPLGGLQIVVEFPLLGEY